MEIVKKTHIGAYGILIKDNKIALIKKARGGYKGKLDLPGGGIEHNETIIEALHRELDEELGVTVIEEKLFDVSDTNIKWQMKEDLYEDLHHIGILYEVKIKENTLKNSADGQDSLGAEWYDIKSLKKEQLSPFALYVINNIKL